jgi:histidinol dehydrogenase
MKIIDLRHDPKGAETLRRRYRPDPEVARVVTDIIHAVEADGDRALIEFASRFDHVELTVDSLYVTPAEVERAVKQVPLAVLEALRASYRNVSAFAQQSRRTDWLSTNAQGAQVGERFDPLDRVGIYIPAGTAPLVSTAIMTAALARVAGVSEIVAASPVGHSGVMDSGLLAALEIAGATEILKIGGAQAIAALAIGTPTIRPVTKIFGPGNNYVVEAKRQLFGFVDVDLLPGPSEIFIIADDTANAGWIAADLLAQAEHGHGSSICLATTSDRLAAAVSTETNRQLAMLHRQEHLREVLERNAYLVFVPDLVSAIRVANDFAPEHLAIMTTDAEMLAKSIRTAGAIFLGNHSPVAVGDFLAGPSHVLPTGGAGKSFGGLTIDQFQRRTSIIQYDREALGKSVEVVRQFSEIERLDAHGHSVAIRFEASEQ